MGWWSRRLGIGVLIMGRLSYVPLLSPLEQFRSSFPPLHRPSQMPNYFTQSRHDFTPPPHLFVHPTADSLYHTMTTLHLDLMSPSPDYPVESQADLPQREIAKYLKPSAPLIFIWNIESNDPGWYASIRALLERHDLGTPQYYRQWWRKCFEVPEFEEYFGGKEEGSSEWSLGMTEDQVGLSHAHRARLG